MSFCRFILPFIFLISFWVPVSYSGEKTVQDLNIVNSVSGSASFAFFDIAGGLFDYTIEQNIHVYDFLFSRKVWKKNDLKYAVQILIQRFETTNQYFHSRLSSEVFHFNLPIPIAFRKLLI